MLPPKEYQSNKKTPKALRASMESTGPLYPLLVGKSVAFRFARTGGGEPPSHHTQDCTVDDYGGVLTTAGPFNVYKLTCHYDGEPFINYYAPKVGRVVLQTGGSIFAGVERELVSYQRGGADTRMAMDKSGTMKPEKGHSEPAKMESPKSMKNKPRKAVAAMRAKPGAKSQGFGIQLAAYSTPKLARGAWKRIKRRGGGLLANMTPAIERHAGKSGVIYRVIVGNYKSKAKAAARCKALKRRRIDCWARPAARGSLPGHSAAGDPMHKAKSQRASAPAPTQERTQAVASAPPERLYYTKP